MRRKGRVDGSLAFQEVVGDQEDAHDELKAKDRLPQGTPDRCVDDLWTFATQACPDPTYRLVGQPIERTFIRRLGELRADV